ncbi:MAG: hypothetical protein ACLRFI_01650 [Alphaproteobacteria bacterium]
MQFFKNSVSFLAVLCVLPGAFAATPRVSVSQNTVSASRRLPTFMVGTNLGNATGRIVAGGTATNTVSSSTANLLSDTECIDAYTSCMKSDDACGSEFENCTTNVLFHGAMPQCFSALYQCSASGIDSLFGTNNVNSLSNIQTTNQYDEITRYTYPTDGSVMGQAIIGSAVRNKYDTANCVKKYKSCLFKDSVCGEEFELCTTDNEFKKQSALCDSVLGRCDVAGIKELFGENVTAKPNGGAGAGVVHEWLDEGADLAAANAVQTCYKVVDNCFLDACKKNPYRCVEGSDLSVINTADFVASGDGKNIALTKKSDTEKQTASDVKKFFKSSCLDTIGTNKYCYMTFKGQTPKQSDLVDVDSQEDIFSEAYSSRKSLINSKLQDLITSFDTKAKSSCVETIKSCAMRSCAGGSGAACYVSVFGKNGDVAGSIAGTSTYNSIKNGCAAIVNADLNCKYAAATYSDDNKYNYTFYDGDNGGAFETLFPKADDGNDPIGAIAALNSSLATSYNSAAIAQKKKQCQNLAANCVRSMCGNEYTNCYRNRTDVSSTLTKTGINNFDNSMNKVGGVLDYTIALGLCLNTVKTSEICEESLAISKAQIKENDVLQGWGAGNTVSQAWTDAGNITHTFNKVQQRDANDKLMCKCTTGDVGICGSESGGDVNCTEAYLVDGDIVADDQAANTLFRELIDGLEKEAQAIYNAKLTAEHNLCFANNNGGIIGDEDSGAYFEWAKLRGKVPSYYATKGLEEKDFEPSNDLYNSFCRVRVSLQSDDKYIQGKLGKNMAYFATGDAFTCGSWISNETLNEISKAVAEEKTGTNEKGKLKNGQAWLTAGITLLGGGVTDVLQTQTGLGGLLHTTQTDSQKKYSECQNALNDYTTKVRSGKTADAEFSKLNQKLTALNKSVVGTDINPEINKKLQVCIGNKYNLNSITISGQYTVAEEKTDVANITGNVVNWIEGEQNKANECVAALNSISSTLDNIKNVCGDKEEVNSNVWSKGLGRGIVDAAGMAVSGITTAQIIKAKNRSDFSEAQQKWLDEVGSKIHCYVGTDEIGTYGDVVSITLE